MASRLTPSRHGKLHALFELALDRAPATRDAFLQVAAPDDPELRAEVLSLLAAHDRADTSLERPAASLLSRVHDGDQPTLVGARVGPYELVRHIGDGGMGSVYEAVRADDQFRKRVAVKLLRPGVQSELAIRRFRYERQILANLEHRNIAGLFDGGVTEYGDPYLVMEYVEGAPITAWCDEQRLGVRERVALFRQVCDAVRHAHQNMVVHRDLKPGNILVASDGTVKLLDFGIAKLLREDEGPDLLPLTHGGMLACTPEYASPEQIRGLPVGTASDVYALGVVLFELLTGRRPLKVNGFLLAEVERVICETPAPRPSAVVDSTSAAVRGERSADRLRARLAGDLDAIVLMALRKEPERRYGSAEQLSLDLGHYLGGHPVSARPEGLGYRFGKFLRRQRLGIAAAAVVVTSVAAGVVATVRQAARADAERDRATEVLNFLATMLGAANPASLGRDVRVREVLDSASIRVDSLRGSPDLEAEIRTVIGNTYVALGEYESAEAQYLRGLAASRRHAPRGDHATSVALTRVASVMEHQGRLGEADSVLTEAWTLLQDHPPPNALARANFLDGRARVLLKLGRATEARPLLDEALRVTLVHNARNDSAVAASYSNFATVVSDLGDNVAAESLFASAVDAARRAFGEEHTLVAAIMSAQATSHERSGKMAAADSTYRAVLAMRRKLLGPEHPEYAWTMFNYADHLVRVKRWGEAAHWAREVLALRGRSLPETHPGVAVAMQIMGRALGPLDSLAAAERWLRESLDLRRRTLPEGHWLLASSESVLGEHFVLARRFEEAERLLLPAERKLVELRGEGTQVVNDVRGRIVALYEAWGKEEEAERWREKIVRGTKGAGP